MKYLKLAEFYEEASDTTKRLEKIEILSKFLKQLDECDRDVLYLLMGDIYPEYDDRKIGISNQLALKCIAKSTGINEKDVLKEWKNIGDLGRVAEKLVSNKKQSTLGGKGVLTTDKVIDNLRRLPGLVGKGTVGKKISLITELLTSASSLEALYLVRTLIGDLRIGVKESTIRDSISSAFFNSEEGASKKIQDAIDKTNDIAAVFDIAAKKKLSGFNKLKLEVGKPIKVMLAEKALTIEDAFVSVGKPCAVEYKYDGFRMLIHKEGDKVMFFTRNLENVSSQFPEVVDYIKKYVKGKSFILDSEAVGFNKKTKEYKPFQEISQRIRRKYNIEKLRDELPVEINVFDILFYEGKSLLSEPFQKRSVLVRKIVKNHPYKIVTSKQIITSDEKKAEAFYKKALGDNQEGAMFKNLSAGYQPGRRVGHMLKIKPESKDLDLVITGGEYGTGKRSGWLSSFILSCRGKKGEFLEVGKMGTGIKEKSTLDTGEDISFNELTEKLKPYFLKESGRTVKIKPKIVVSVTYQEIQNSPNYNSGFALRFPRFTALRPDRSPDSVSTLEELKKDYDSQKRNWRYG